MGSSFKSLLQELNHPNSVPIHLTLIQRMEKLLSCGIDHQTVPQSYILPPEKRPVVNPVNPSKTVPLIDLENNRHEIVKQILQAGKEFGIFQVVNHGVPETVMSNMIGVAKEFFEMPIEDKAPYYTEDPRKSIILNTSTRYEYDATLYWRDFLRLTCYPLEEWMHLWPEKPSKFRENLAKFVVQVRELAIRLLRLVCEGLGLEEDYFTGDLIGGPVAMNVNHYMPCPDPSLTLGLLNHTDINLITLLLQGNVNGLQALCDGDWIEVEPVPHSFVVIFRNQLEFITNGMLRCAEHRAMTNSTISRTSIATFIGPTMDSLIAPAESIVNQHSPPLYKSFMYKDFFSTYFANVGNKERAMEVFRIKKG